VATALFAMSASAEPGSIAKCVQELHTANRLRQAWGELPAQKTETAPIRDLGVQLVRDHVVLDGALLQYAGTNGIELKDVPLPPASIDQPSFDAKFLATLERHNATMLRSVDACLRLTADPQFRRVLNKALATYRDHQRAVDRAYRELLPAT